MPAVPGAHTQAGNLVKLDEHVREVIALVLDLPEGAEADLELDYEYPGIGPEAAAAIELGHARAQLDLQHEELVSTTNQVVIFLVRQGWSVRDVGPMVGVSPARISQIVREHGGAPTVVVFPAFSNSIRSAASNFKRSELSLGG